jgi:hypothetical protein
MKKKQKYAPSDARHVEVGQGDGPRLGLRKFQEEERAKEKVIVDAAAATAAENKAVALAATVQTFWGVSHKRITHLDPVATKREPMARDLGLQVADGPTTKEEFQSSYLAFADNLTARTGYILSKAGHDRTMVFGRAQALAFGKAFTTEEAWLTAFFRLLSCHCYQDDEIGQDLSQKTYRDPEPVAAPAPSPTYDDLMKVDGTREGFREARYIANKLYDREEAMPVMTAWLFSLRDNFRFTPSEEVLQKIIDWFLRNNKSFLDRRAYDEARRWAVKQKLFPFTCLTQDELVARQIEAADLTNMDFDRKMNLKRSLLKQQEN